MKKYLYTIFVFTFLFWGGVLAQNEQLQDKGTNFVQTPPGQIHQNITDVEEIFGSNAFSFGPFPQRARGNLFTCNTSATISEHRLYINPSVATTLWFCVYESDVQAGAYNQISAVEVTNQGPGAGWYSSGPVSISLIAGKYYLIYCQWEGSTAYYNQQAISPYPIQCSFGELTAGAGWSVGSVPIYGNPPPASQNITSGAFADPVAYYQAIVSEVIPVELTSFTAAVIDGNVSLNWITASEINNHGFEVQKSINGSEFITIAFVSGNGTTTETKHYNYVDKNIAAGSYKYRLKQVDFDGRFEYSPVVEVDFESLPVSFSLGQNFPNPFNPSTTISFSLPVESNVIIKVFNVVGEEISTIVNGNFAAGVHNINFAASNLNSGVYIYSIKAVGTDGSSYSEVEKMVLAK